MQWNKVTGFSKTIALILFIALPFIGLWIGLQYGELIGYTKGVSVPVSGSSTSTLSGGVSSGLPVYYTTPSEWQLDSNNSGFSISYPIDFDTTDNYPATPSTDWRLNSNGEPGVKYFTLTVPRAFEPQTNFVDATLTVGASGDSMAVSQCLTPDQTGGEAMATSSVTINGVQFTIFSSNGAGAGNYYQTTSYRTLHAGKCYAVEYTLHSGQIANYPASYGLQPFDQATITALMQNIVGTLKFSS